MVIGIRIDRASEFSAPQSSLKPAQQQCYSYVVSLKTLHAAIDPGFPPSGQPYLIRVLAVSDYRWELRTRKNDGVAQGIYRSLENARIVQP